MSLNKEDLLNTKVRFQLLQPTVKCDGRDDVTCYYTSRVYEVDPDKNVIFIDLKYKNKKIETYYNLDLDIFVLRSDNKDLDLITPNYELQDIKLKQ